MARMPVHDVDSSEIVGYLDIPDDVIEAAVKVEEWMRCHRTIELHGLKLADAE